MLGCAALRAAGAAAARRAPNLQFPQQLQRIALQGSSPVRKTLPQLLRSTGRSTSIGNAFRFKSTMPLRDAAADAARVAGETVVSAEGGLVKAGYERAVGWWLVGTSGMLISMIAIGGYTRLSGSGLSMTDWTIEGRSLPRNDAAWLAEFEEYKRFPEYQRMHAGRMELEEFKFIYFVEWFHRMWGRSAGLIFAIPLGYFAAKRILRPALALRLSGLLVLGLSQAFVGWWMVRSGFDAPEKHTPLQGPKQRPRVSPYRLASHWTAALTLYAGTVWHALLLLRPSPSVLHGSVEAIAAASKIHKLLLPVAGMVILTLLSGPFVAGNDAGHAYNTWPKMLDDWVPPEWMAAASDPLRKWRAFFEDTAVVQFDHRSLAYLSAIASLGIFAYSTQLPLSVAAVNAVRLLPMAVVAQMCLGIATLMLYVPIELGVAHQGGGVAVLTTVLFVLHAMRTPVPLRAFVR